MELTVAQIIGVIVGAIVAILMAAGRCLAGAGKFYSGLAEYTKARKLPAPKETPNRSNKSVAPRNPQP